MQPDDNVAATHGGIGVRGGEEEKKMKEQQQQEKDTESFEDWEAALEAGAFDTKEKEAADEKELEEKEKILVDNKNNNTTTPTEFSSSPALPHLAYFHTQGQPVPARPPVILRRADRQQKGEKGSGGTITSGQTNNGNPRTMAERERDYAEARARIFGSSPSPSSSPSRSPSSRGARAATSTTAGGGLSSSNCNYSDSNIYPQGKLDFKKGSSPKSNAKRRP
eukprot:Nk52_evm5s533 gene=Nk52_evmTU5s533